MCAKSGQQSEPIDYGKDGNDKKEKEPDKDDGSGTKPKSSKGEKLTKNEFKSITNDSH